MTKESRKPELRFDGFEDAWEQRKLGTLGNSVSWGTLFHRLSMG